MGRKYKELVIESVRYVLNVRICLGIIFSARFFPIFVKCLFNVFAMCLSFVISTLFTMSLMIGFPFFFFHLYSINYLVLSTFL